jgi:hypothetical protein
MPNKKWQFTFADFKSCWLIHTNLFRWASEKTPNVPVASSHSDSGGIERGGRERGGETLRELLSEINNKNCCRALKKNAQSFN